MFHFFSFFFASYKCKQLEEIRVEYMKNDSAEYTNPQRKKEEHATFLRADMEGNEVHWERRGEMQDDFKKIFAVKLKVTL